MFPLGVLGVLRVLGMPGVLRVLGVLGGTRCTKSTLLRPLHPQLSEMLETEQTKNGVFRGRLANSHRSRDNQKIIGKSFKKGGQSMPTRSPFCGVQAGNRGAHFGALPSPLG